MKEAYEKLAVMVEAVDSEDVITTSTGGAIQVENPGDTECTEMGG